MLYGEHHGRLTRIHLDHITFLDRSIAAIEDDIAAILDAIPAAQGIDAAGVPSPDPGPGWHASKTDTDRRTRSLLNQLRALHPTATSPSPPPPDPNPADQARDPHRHGPLNHAPVWLGILTVRDRRR